MDISRIIEDIKFAEEDSDELPTAADILRYAAALNPEATRKEFVEAAVACGYPPNSSANRFRESRNFDVKEYGYLLAKDGSLIITE
jgi:hypothetical protein